MQRLLMHIVQQQNWLAEAQALEIATLHAKRDQFGWQQFRRCCQKMAHSVTQSQPSTATVSGSAHGAWLTLSGGTHVHNTCV